MYTGTFYELRQNDIINAKQIMFFDCKLSLSRAIDLSNIARWKQLVEKKTFKGKSYKKYHYLVLSFHLFIIIFGLWRYDRGKVCNWYRTWIRIYLFDWFGIFDNNVPWFKSWIITISDIQNPFFCGFDLKIIIFTNWLKN